MMVEKLEKIGDSVIGFLFDGVDDRLAPPVAAVEIKGLGRIIATVPFVHTELIDADDAIRASFEKTRDWTYSYEEKAPEGLLIRSVGQIVTLTELSSGGFDDSVGLGTAVFRAGVAILEEPRKILDEYSVKEFTSTIDGLREFARFQGFEFTNDQGPYEKGQLPIRLMQAEPVSWTSGGLEFRIEMGQPWNAQQGNYMHLDVTASLSTLSKSGVPIMEHFNAQKKIRALLVLIHGTRLPWRSHALKDEQFPVRVLSGEFLPPEPVKVLLARTLKEHEEPVDSGAHLFNPAVSLATLGAAGLKTWCDRYDEDEVFHAVAPAVEAFANKGAFVEPTLVQLAGACERFGYLLTHTGKPPVSRQFKACIQAARFYVLELGVTDSALSEFLARVYNGLKHPDAKFGSPEFLDTIVAYETFKVLTRAQALVLIGAEAAVIEAFVRSEGQSLKRAIENNAFSFADAAQPADSDSI